MKLSAIVSLHGTLTHQTRSDVSGGVVGVLPGRGNCRIRQLEQPDRRDPVEAWSGGIALAILIGAVAGLMPAPKGK